MSHLVTPVKKGTNWGIYIFTMIAIGFFLWFLYSFLIQYSIDFASQRQGQCTVTDSGTDLYYGSNSGYSYVAYFQLTVQTQEGKSYQGSWSTEHLDTRDQADAVAARYPVGGTYPCWYHPSDPTMAELEQSFDILRIVFVVVIALVGTSMLIRLWRLSRRR